MEQRVKAVLFVAMTVVLAITFVYLAVYGVLLVTDGGTGVARGMGVGVLLLTALGVWSTVVMLRNGLQLQRISAAAAAEGVELDTSGLARRPSGRVVREDADRLFDEVGEEYRRSPEDWRSVYRLARAYDHAGDRARARETMRRALDLWTAERRASPAGRGSTT